MFEITESSLAAVSPRNPGQHKQEILAERGLAASPGSPNLLKPQLFRDALVRFSAPGAMKRNAAALVIPDYAARMAILDFEQFPQGEEERAALLRFRLKKTVPFHIDEAQLSYAIQLNEPKRVEVLAVAIARPILDEYEALFVESGYRVGLVTPSCLPTLRLCTGAESQGLTLLAKLAGSTVSVLLVDRSRIRLVRCLDLSGSDDHTATDEPDGILPLLQQTVAYAEDQIGEPVKRLLLCGFGADTEALGRAAQREYGLPFGTVRSKFGAASQENAGLLGMLEQYAG